MSTVSRNINLEDYHYNLPQEKIAKEPLPNRSDSKLLIYRKGKISHSVFRNLTENLPVNSHLVFNDTKVIPARLHFFKETGALIEIFLLEPVAPTNEVASAMLVKSSCQWRCMIGNQKKWKENITLSKEISSLSFQLKAKIVDRENQIVEFNWSADLEFVHVVEAAGKIPLPPYIKREVTTEDHNRYQTVYSQHEGAVAAPTAGLHFDSHVESELKKAKIKMDYVTLHVSAGTFQPVKVKNAVEHKMHAEQIVISKETILNLLDSINTIAVGTTSMRTLESLYWFGIKLLKEENNEFFINKLYPYESDDHHSKEESLQAVLNHMDQAHLKTLTGTTEIYILPGYQFRICKGLITNYHLPGSTLMLLVAAFVGESWKSIYQEALENEYRFLSYGDSSLLLP